MYFTTIVADILLCDTIIKVFSIHLAGKMIAQRRYREFDALHGNVWTPIL